MPRYYFNLYREGTPVPDEEGLELEDDAVAKREAMESLRELIAESLDDGLKPAHVSVEVIRAGSGPVSRVTGRIVIHEQV